jgi:hypothetical protein
VLEHAWFGESSSDAVGVKQYTPKSSPMIVTLPKPVRTALGGSEKLTTGAVHRAASEASISGKPDQAATLQRCTEA